MNLSQRKKKPPDLLIFLSGSFSGGHFPATLPLSLLYSESSSPLALFPGLDLYHCSGQPLCSGYLCLLSIFDLNLHDLQGDRSSASADSGDWSSYLLAPASLASPIGDSSSILGFGCGYTDRHKVLMGLLPLPPILPWLVAVKAN